MPGAAFLFAACASEAGDAISNLPAAAGVIRRGIKLAQTKIGRQASPVPELDLVTERQRAGWPPAGDGCPEKLFAGLSYARKPHMLAGAAQRAGTRSWPARPAGLIR